MKHIKKFKIYQESLVNQKSLDQFKAIRKLSKGIDIGDRIKKMKGANLAGESNFIDDSPETIEQYFKKNKLFKVNQNTKNFKPSMINEAFNEESMLKQLLEGFTICFLSSYLSHMLLSDMEEVQKIVSSKIDSHQVNIKLEDRNFAMYCSDAKCLVISAPIMGDLIQTPSQFPAKWAKVDPEKTESYGFFREYILDTCIDVIEKMSKDKQYEQ